MFIFIAILHFSAKINTCAFGSQGKMLLTQSINSTDARGVRWSPTMYLQNTEYCQFGGEKCKAGSYSDYVRDVCAASTSTSKPDACNK